MLTWVGIEELYENEKKWEKYLACARLKGLRVIDAAKWLEKKSCGSEAGEGRDEDCEYTDSYPFWEGLFLLKGEECLRRALSQNMPLIWQWKGEGSDVPAQVRYLSEGEELPELEYLYEVYARYHKNPLTIVNDERMFVCEISLDRLEDVHRTYQVCPKAFAGNVPCGRNEEEGFWEAYIRNMYGFYGYGMWLAYTRKGGQLLGRAGLEHIDETLLSEGKQLHKLLASERLCLQAGYMVMPQWRRQGYGRRLLCLCVEFGFERAGAEDMILLIEPDNAASIALAEKSGFSWLEKGIYDGKEVAVYRLCRESWMSENSSEVSLISKETNAKNRSTKS